MYKRLQRIQRPAGESCFLWGPRQTGKSTLLKEFFPDSLYYDLFLSEQFERLSRKPSLLREEVLAPHARRPVVIDEIQTIPALLGEVQWLMVNHKVEFVLCGSSARKVKRSGAQLLGGRALRFELYPLVSSEIPDFDLLTALNNGLLPRHYVSKYPLKLIQAYVGDYLKEEIAAEAVSRNIPAFSRFLESAAFSNGEIINYQNIASECGVSAPTVKSYFQILSDTLVGRLVPSFRKRPKRRTITAPKFYFFDVGIANFLLKRGYVHPGGEIFGKAFEHFIFQEIIAHSHYSNISYDISYWRTTSQFEVDFILGDCEAAVEVKGVDETLPRHLRGLKAFREEYNTKRSVIVSLDPMPRMTDGIEILPWRIFLEELWAGKIMSS